MCVNLEKAFAPFSKCPEDKPYCMNDIYHSDGLVDVYERWSTSPKNCGNITTHYATNTGINIKSTTSTSTTDDDDNKNNNNNNNNDNGSTYNTDNDGCVDEATCYAEWYFRSSDKAECSQYDPNVYTGALTCHLCCRGDLCVQLQYTNWAPGQPPIADNGCIAMETNKAGVWMTFPCHMDTFADIEYPFVCEFRTNTPCTDLETVFAPFTICPEDKPYCMNDIYHRGGLTDIFQSQVNQPNTSAPDDAYDAHYTQAYNTDSHDNNAKTYYNHDNNAKTYYNHDNNVKTYYNHDNNAKTYYNHDNNAQTYYNNDNNANTCDNYDYENDHASANNKTQALEDDGCQHLVVADGAPQHEAGPAPGVVFHDTVVSIAVTSSSPYPNTPVGMVNAETAFIAEKHVLPANIVPVVVALRPLQACLSMAHAELHTKCVTANSGFTWTASALMR
nr:hypothetical protein BaRGS_031236 [Batillaria attramentaria]